MTDMTTDITTAVPSLQVTLDAEDPHAQARFWAEAIGYVKEDHTAIVQGLLDAGHLPAEAAIDVDGGKGFAELAACSDPGGARPRLLFQRVPEKKTVKNRMHLDLHVGPERAEAEAERLLALGATHAWTTDDRGGHTITLRDPEGNELCVE
jgi:hypothetical protein